MGHKVSPVSFRLQYDKKWQSCWFANGKDFAKNLLGDIQIRNIIMAKFGFQAAIAKIEIERKKGETKVIIHTARPGVIIGHSGKGIEEINAQLHKGIAEKVKIDVIEVKKPEIVASLVAQNVAGQISKRIHYKRAVKFAIDKAMQAGAKGIRIAISGRLGGAEIARSEKYSAGPIPLSTLRADIDFAKVDAYTTYGINGVKVWIYKGDKVELE
ncbi:MAG: 30S ribosomal protein S3 [Candidatus Nealsonbacteria bacterium CG23_combo_of_CG06-09_8_20_14_all_40_13]|uniref:Small ribosomal subunit protein uS3 n=1 Tax=Candidatus Nealsonbacteria bacterium CG23_combo_of_CG06-09_8_20_14_all_40_13 TaxID=1974724 RepID=A0A2G9YQR6_9BACT|nr:MAG: 30S ribosomal protein S3 [Candidatus Nealsonbacteria bacterium CG23_combo_of_CG06-09_8_20_14_all_40_13]PIR71195.1 MAG: 30S ribosomal protein S3 [Candidatus Nealsonbacteria bacterium CG10_big_fil_rev_8_21_14_0_10_40_24]PIU43441.1 MAG: 30S ribosomal protein S3 [Candidatus Nealsonbacteria bacterium CG07_land_8_20_14_0_80_40_10]